MAWNEPGGGGNNGKDNDPWGKKKNDGPPDLDDVLKNMSNKIKGFFGGNKGGGGGGGGPSRQHKGSAGLSLVWLLIIVILGWAATGLYVVDQAERAVVQTFGKFSDIKGAGLHWHFPYPIEKKTIVNVDRTRTEEHTQEMLTKDEKIVQIELSVQYKISNVKDYLFNVRDPDNTLREVMESALREALGARTMEQVLGQEALTHKKSRSRIQECKIEHDDDPLVQSFVEDISNNNKTDKGKIKKESGFAGREQLRVEVENKLQSLLDDYKTGIVLRTVNLKRLKPPAGDVAKAFEDVIKAQEDADRYIQKAWENCARVVNKAHGERDKMLKEAEAYKNDKILSARGEADRFLQVYREYQKAPEVTRSRYYLEAQEKILSKVRKILVKVKQGNNVLFLPLDKYMGKSKGAAAASGVTTN